MAKNINTILSLKDKFTAPLKKVTASTKEMEDKIKKNTKSIERFGRQANNTFNSMVKNSGKAILAITGIGSVLSVATIKSYASESINLAKDQLEAEVQLAAMLKNVQSIQAKGPEYYKQAAVELRGVASQLQNVGVIGDEVTLAGMNQLATFQLSEKQIAVLSVGMTDLLAKNQGLTATQQDATNAANMIGKAMMGNVGALSRVGISFDPLQAKMIKFGDATQRAATIAEVLQMNIGGANEALAQTDQGKIQQMQNAYGDMREEIGKKLLPVQAKMANWFFEKIPQLQTILLGFIDSGVAKLKDLVVYFKGIYPKIQPTLARIKEGVGFAFQAIGTAVKLAVEHLDVLAPALLGVVAGFTAFNIITKVTAMVGLFAATVGNACTMVTALNLVLRKNPIVVVAIAIGLLVGAVMIAYNKSEKFRAIINDLWARMKTMAEGLMTKLKPAFESLSNYFQSDLMPVIENLKIIFMTLWQKVLLPFGKMLIDGFTPWFKLAFDAIVWIVGGAFEMVKIHIKSVVDVLKGITDFIIGVFTRDWTKAWEGLKGIFKGIVEGFTGIFGTFFGGIFEGIENMKNGFLELIGLGSDASKEPRGAPTGARTLPGHATGTGYFAGGATRVNEGGRGEIMNLPSGTQIIPHDVSKKAGGATVAPIVNITIQGNVIGNAEYADYLGSVITKRILSSMAII